MSLFHFPDDVTRWETGCRPETLSRFERFVYGCRPETLSSGCLQDFVGSEHRSDGVVYRDAQLQYGNCRFTYTLFRPDTEEKTPCIIYILHPQQANRIQIKTNWANAEIPIADIIRRGCSIALLSADEVAADRPDGVSTGIFAEVKDERTPESWGVISAWSWSASRVLDHLSGCPNMDAAAVAVAGHSRGGKAALWAAAEDRRFAACFSNCSGCTGAALARGCEGETVRQINTVFPHWFADVYKNYNDNENALPVDQHQLLALIAPRKLLVASASEDSWADPDGELLSATLASNAYALYGGARLRIDNLQPDRLYSAGNIAYFRRTGTHAVTREAWMAFLSFFLGE